MEELKDMYGFTGDGNELPAGATSRDLEELNLGVFTEELAELKMTYVPALVKLLQRKLIRLPLRLQTHGKENS